MTTENDVLVLGGAGVDTVVYVPTLPLPFADSYLVPAIETRAGQTGDGVALGLHALGLRTVHVDVLGDDPEGVLVRGLHERHGVPFTAVPAMAGTKRAVNLVDPQGRLPVRTPGREAGRGLLPPRRGGRGARLDGAEHARRPDQPNRVDSSNRRLVADHRPPAA
jgi:hypothetical protein